ncbi:OsmC family protein [soil metagenome]|jgi:organic hydroperoxide reductase OsmC/OhrA
MDDRTHRYDTRLAWHGSTATGPRGYGRTHRVSAPPARAALDLSADPHFRGDPDLMNPEQLLVVAASSCQLLSFLALVAAKRIDVVGYADDAHGLMPEAETPVRLTRIDLAPVITVAGGTDHDLVRDLVHQAHELCYVANSLSTEVVVQPTVTDA